MLGLDKEVEEVVDMDKADEWNNRMGLVEVEEAMGKLDMVVAEGDMDMVGVVGYNMDRYTQADQDSRVARVARVDLGSMIEYKLVRMTEDTGQGKFEGEGEELVEG